MDIHRVGVIGCGLMGSGIAQCAAEAGYEVWVKEADETLLTRGLARVQGAWDRAVAKGKATDAQRVGWTGNLHGTLAFSDLATCDLVVEAIPEQLDLKLQTFAELEDWEGLNFDLIITLSPEAHHKALELTRTVAAEVEYWPTPDPTGTEGSREQKLAAYREVCDGLSMRIRRRFSRAPAAGV